ncbi:3'-5' exonuclease Snipper [Aedes albopictus]|uniref:Exonuclease domain-containing protein n=1 Tax=Aedes albopictus TaxID=7160 RepID=A0ABM1Z452_AEDAL
MSNIDQQKDLADLLRLAKALNAVAMLHVRGGAASLQRSQSSHPTFQYLIIIDFEATCWSAEDAQKWRKNEIIEFPAVLLNLSNGQIESEFRQYVMPIENPRLSEFCTQLTGIRQDQVEGGVPLHTCLSLFDKWLQKSVVGGDRRLVLPKTAGSSNPTGTVAFATWTDWDLGSCLTKECARKRINKAGYFDQWIDVRAIYKTFYQHNPKSFADALSTLGMGFEGRPHCGMDDSRNIARLVAKMRREGANFVITKDLRPFELFNK